MTNIKANKTLHLECLSVGPDPLTPPPPDLPMLYMIDLLVVYAWFARSHTSKYYMARHVCCELKLYLLLRAPRGAVLIYG